MADTNSRVGIVITGEDKSKPALASATKGVSKFKDNLKQLPEHAGKASAALLLMQSSAGQMSGQMADAVNKIGALVALIAVGGPFGLAIGAIAAGLAGVTAILEALYPPMEDVKDEFAEINANIDDQNRKIGPLITSQRELRKAMEETKEAARTLRQALDEGLDAATTNSRLLREMEEKLAADRKKRAEAREKAISSRRSSLNALNNFRIKLFEQESERLAASADLEIAQMARVDAAENASREKRMAANMAAVDAQKAANLAANREVEAESVRLAEKRKAQIESTISDVSALAISATSTIADMNATSEEKVASISRLILSELSKRAAAFVTAKITEIAVTQAAAEAERNQAAVTTATVVANEAAKTAAVIAAAEVQAAASSGGAAAKAIEAHAGIPFIGVAIGVAAAAAAIAAIMSAQKLAQGGLVTGGTPGRDSVPAMLMPGERVISAPNAQDPHRQSGGGDTINNYIGTIDATPQGRTKLAKTISKEQRRNKRLGLAGVGA